MPRPRTPANLRILQGNPAHRPIPEEIEAPPPEGKTPTWLRSKATKDAWGDLEPMLEEAGVLSALDEIALGMLVQVFVKARRGDLKAIAELRRWLNEFGMTPASRSKIAPREKKDPGNAWDELDRMGV